MIKFVQIIAVMLSALIFFSCTHDDPVAPKLDYEPEIVVFGLLMVTERDEGHQKTVRIERSFEITDTLPPYPEGRAVTDASVFIETENQRVEFVHTFHSNYEDVYDELQLVPGQLYKLDITMPDGHKITSQCIMPDKPNITFPRSLDPVEAFSSLTVAWDSAAYAHRYQIAVEEDMGSFQLTTFSAGTSEDLYVFVFARPNKYFLKVASLDQNYYDYLRSGSDSQPISHISGALGVFGAIAYDKSIFYAVSP